LAGVPGEGTGSGKMDCGEDTGDEWVVGAEGTETRTGYLGDVKLLGEPMRRVKRGKCPGVTTKRAQTSILKSREKSGMEKKGNFGQHVIAVEAYTEKVGANKGRGGFCKRGSGPVKSKNIKDPWKKTSNT